MLPDGVNNDEIVHHDDDPGEAAQDEYECDHDEDQGQSLFTRTDRLFIYHSCSTLYTDLDLIILFLSFLP